MGSRIAAHFANAGLPCVLLDIVPANLSAEAPPAERNKIVRAGLEAARKSKPAAFFTPSLADKIAIGNFEDDLARCAEADWIVEAVAENLEIKRKLLGRVAQFRKPGAIVTTNTSGLPVHLIAEGMSEEFQEHWAGFFNPPRYLKLVEVIPGPKTSREVIETLNEFCDRRLGKGVVIAEDTPNFIANRIGTFSMLNALRLMNRLQMTVEEVDACTGPAVGWPKSATFRTADIVGLDVLVHVVKNIYETAPNDESRETYKVPALVEEMVKRGWLGDKTGQGFYKKVRGAAEKEILVLDPNTMEYRPRQKAKFASLEMGKAIEDTRERLRALVGPLLDGQKGDKAQQFIWGGLSEMCLYAARRVPEISDNLADVDRAMRWGFGWDLGPFAMMDAVGVKAFAAQVQKDPAALFLEIIDPSGAVIPNAQVATKNESTGKESVVRTDDSGRARVSGLAKGQYEVVIVSPGFATKTLTHIFLPNPELRRVQLDLGVMGEVVVVGELAPDHRNPVNKLFSKIRRMI